MEKSSGLFLFAVALVALMPATAAAQCGSEPMPPRERAVASEPVSQYVGPPPPATIPLQHYRTRENASLEPSELTVEGAAVGDIITEDKMLYLPADATPGKGDVLICLDLSGSMAGALNNVRNNSINIMNAVRAVIPNSRFGVISHMDYSGVHGGCGYSATYGAVAQGDYPYSLDQPLIYNATTVADAINALTLGDGWDQPESYTRALYEAYDDPGIGWRTEAKKILLQWGDSIPHDCAYDACLSGSTTTGPDPGRDGVDNNGDDLEILPVLNELASQEITLLALHIGIGQDLDLWGCYAAITGGEVFQVCFDGNLPGGEDIAEIIASIIGETVDEIGYMTLEVCTPGFEAWLVDVEPDGYSDIVLDVPHELPFVITIQIPQATPPGWHCFDICAIGDGAEYARQHVCIEVVEPVATEPSTWGKIKNEYR